MSAMLAGDVIVAGETPATLADAEAIIERGMASFVDVGRALTTIRDQRLYLEAGFTDFESYSRQRWGWTRTRSDYLIAAVSASDTVTTVVGIGPVNERQARELSVLKEEPEQMAEAWKEAVAEADEKGTHVTAAMVKRAVAKKLPPPASEKKRRTRRSQDDLFRQFTVIWLRADAETRKRISDWMNDPGR